MTVKYGERKCNDQMHVEENNCRGSMASEWENSSSRLRIVQSIKIVYIWSEKMESIR